MVGRGLRFRPFAGKRADLRAVQMSIWECIDDCLDRGEIYAGIRQSAETSD